MTETASAPAQAAAAVAQLVVERDRAKAACIDLSASLRHISAERDRLREVNAELLEALREIAKGEGRFSRDQLEHASNTIDDMKNIARAAIAKATSSDA